MFPNLFQCSGAMPTSITRPWDHECIYVFSNALPTFWGPPTSITGPWEHEHVLRFHVFFQCSGALPTSVTRPWEPENVYDSCVSPMFWGPPDVYNRALGTCLQKLAMSTWPLLTKTGHGHLASFGLHVDGHGQRLAGRAWS